MAHTFHSGYMTRAWEPVAIWHDARDLLRDVDYDTLVGTGLSGAIVVPGLARRLRKHALILRKEGDGSHSWLPAEGTLGDRWVFVDDFIDSGATLRRAKDSVANLVKRKPGPRPEYVGAFLYNQPQFARPGTTSAERREQQRHQTYNGSPVDLTLTDEALSWTQLP